MRVTQGVGTFLHRADVIARSEHNSDAEMTESVPVDTSLKKKDIWKNESILWRLNSNE
jgi:hypothetical protein